MNPLSHDQSNRLGLKTFHEILQCVCRLRRGRRPERDDHGVIGTPGGDTGELALALGAYEATTGVELEQHHIDALVQAIEQLQGAAVPASALVVPWLQDQLQLHHGVVHDLERVAHLADRVGDGLRAAPVPGPWIWTFATV